MTSAMTVEFKGKKYSLTAGNNKILGIKFEEGVNLLTFEGRGTVTIENKGGSL